MKFTLAWLQDHFDTDADLAILTERLTAQGLEVDGVVDRGRSLAPFKVAEVLSAEQHPDADRLRVCIVDTGEDEVQVVCGAPNARAGMKAVYAPSGSYIPGLDMTLKPARIRGVESNGMLVSERELELSDEHSGIIEMPADAPVGAPYARIAGLDDPVIEVGLTPNRGDCAGVRGIARDLAAAGLGALKNVTAWATAVEGKFESPVGITLDFGADTANACPMFGGRLIRGVKNGPSPSWLQDRLRAVGLRPISALVDITNYFSLDMARPLHVFDADKLQGGLTVRLARQGESLEALDGRTYELDEAMTVIADDSGVLSLGGIMGGEASGCTEETVNVFLECALFDPLRTATTGRKLGTQSDARYRFERGVDPTSVPPALEAATRMILELCGGEPSEPVIVGSEPSWQREVAFRPARLGMLGGVDVPPTELRRILSALGFETMTDGEEMMLRPPSWRPDIEGEADIVEEVLRVYGYDHIPVESLPRLTPLPCPALDELQSRPVRVKRALAARGLVEAVTFSFMPAALTEAFGGGQPGLRVDNPISAELDMMRPSILPNLMAAAQRNVDRDIAAGSLFEVGPQYAGATADDQALVAAGLRWGAAVPRSWMGPARDASLFDAKADALGALEAAGAPITSLQVENGGPGWYHPGRVGTLRLGRNVLAVFGELHPALREKAGLDEVAVGFEVYLDNVPKPKARASKARPALERSPFQPVTRDFAFVVGEDVPADALRAAALGVDRNLVTEIDIFDVYQGEHLEAGHKSVAIAVTLQPRKATLTDEEIETISGKIIAAVEQATGGRLRG